MLFQKDPLVRFLNSCFITKAILPHGDAQMWPEGCGAEAVWKIICCI